MEDRPGRGMEMVPAARAGPRLALLFGVVALEDTAAVAARAMSMFAVRRVAGAPQMLQAGSVVGELLLELRQRVLGGRGLRSRWLVGLAGGMVSTNLTANSLSS
jgi:hypothetical protein